MTNLSSSIESFLKTVTEDIYVDEKRSHFAIALRYQDVPIRIHFEIRPDGAWIDIKATPLKVTVDQKDWAGLAFFFSILHLNDSVAKFYWTIEEGEVIAHTRVLLDIDSAPSQIFLSRAMKLTVHELVSSLPGIVDVINNGTSPDLAYLKLQGS